MSAGKWLLLLLPVLALGCVSGAGNVEYSTEGVAVTYFAPDVSELSSGQPFNLRAQVQNLGESEARNVDLTFYKYGNLEGDLTNKNLVSLTRPDPLSGIPGEIGEKTWRLSAPTVTGRNEEVTQEVGLTLSYTYSTFATLEIPILPEDAYLQYQQQGSLPTKRTDSSAAPVKLSFEAPDRIFGEDTFTLNLDVENIGGGYISQVRDGEINVINRLLVTLPAGVSVVDKNEDDILDDCDFALSPDGKGIAAHFIPLWSTGKTRLTCEFEIDPNTELYPVFEATATYTYNIEKTTQLKISGKRLYVQIDSITFDCGGSDQCESDGKVLYASQSALDGDEIGVTVLGTAKATEVRLLYGDVPIADDYIRPEEDASSSSKYTFQITDDESALPIDTLVKPTAELTLSATVRKTPDTSLYIDTEPPTFEFPGLVPVGSTYSVLHSTFRGEHSRDLLVGDDGVGLGTENLLSPTITAEYTGDKLHYTLPRTLADASTHEITLNPEDKLGNSNPVPFGLIITIDNTVNPKMEFDSFIIPGDTDESADIYASFKAWAMSVDNIRVPGEAITLTAVASGGGEPGTFYTVDSAGKETLLSGEPLTVATNSAGDSIDLRFRPPLVGGNPELGKVYTITASTATGEPVSDVIYIGKVPAGSKCMDNDDCASGMCFEWGGENGICTGSGQCAYDGSLYNSDETRCGDGEDDAKTKYTCTPDSGAIPDAKWEPEVCPIGCELGRCSDYDETHVISAFSDISQGTAKKIYNLGGAKYKVTLMGGDARIKKDGPIRISVMVRVEKPDGTRYKEFLEGTGAYRIFGDVEELSLYYVAKDNYWDYDGPDEGTVQVRVESLTGDDANLRTIHIGSRSSDNVYSLFYKSPPDNPSGGYIPDDGDMHILKLEPYTTYKVTLDGAGINFNIDDGGDFNDPEKDDGTYMGFKRIMVGFRRGDDVFYTCQLVGRGSWMKIDNPTSALIDAEIFGYAIDTKTIDNYGSVTLLVEPVERDRSYFYAYSRDNVKQHPDDGTFSKGTGQPRPYATYWDKGGDGEYDDIKTFSIEMLPEFKAFSSLHEDEMDESVLTKAYVRQFWTEGGEEKSNADWLDSGTLSTDPAVKAHSDSGNAADYMAFVKDSDTAGNEGCIAFKINLQR